MSSAQGKRGAPSRFRRAESTAAPKVIAVIPPIRVEDYERERRRRQYQDHAGPGIAVDVRLLRGGPPLTDREYELFWTTAYMILEAEAAEREGAAAVVIDCTADPGFTQIAEAVNIPVVGALQAGVHLALQLGRSFSVLALDAHWARMIDASLTSCGLGGGKTSTEVVGTHVYQPRRGRVMNKSESGKFYGRLLDAGRRAIAAGADTVILGSTTIIEDITRLQADLGIPVIPPGIAALKTAELMLSSGLHMSRRAFPAPAIRFGDQMRKNLGI